jgi:RimJ/RimL family protein N-acetyltransferase/4-amino-4-deoxy-L-arabinose transferase-like glycosyltransferase
MQRSDIPALVALWSDPEVTRYMGGPREEVGLSAIFGETAEDPFGDRYDLRPVEEKRTGRVVGHCGLLEKEVDGQTEVELVFVFARSAWGRGYATEMASALKRYAFEQLGLRRLIALIEPGNARSESVAIKIGMHCEREVVRPDGAVRRVYAAEPGDRDGPKSETRSARIVLACVVALYLLVGGLLNTVIPLGEAPDEPAHFLYVRYVARNGRLPIMAPRYEDNETVEAFQPPLYYVLAALLTGPVAQQDVRLFPNPAFTFGSRLPAYLPLAEHGFPWRGGYLAWHLVRFVSLALGVVSLWATYRAGLLVFEQRWLALGAVAYLALNPQFVTMHSSITNDVAAVVAGSLMSLVALQLLRRPAVRGFLAAALVIALGLLSKPSALTLLPGLAVALWLAWRRLPSARKRWQAAAVLTTVPLALGGWWFLRNHRLYGDLLGLTAARRALAANYYPSPLALGQLLDLIPAMFWQTFRSSWGYFGWLAVPLPVWVFVVILALHVLALLGILFALRASALRRPSTVVLGLAWLGLVGGFLFYAREVNSSGWHGRFLFAGSTVAALGFVAGYRHWFRGRERILAGLILGSNGALMVGALVGVVFPLYLPPGFLPPEAAVPHPTDMRFSGGLRLVGFEVAPPVAAPGDTVEIALYWKAQDEIAADYRFSVGGHTVLGTPVVPRRESALSGRFPPVLWPTDEIAVDRYRLEISRDADQVVGHLYLQVLRGYEEPRPVPYLDPTGQPAGETVDLGPIVIRSETRPDGPRGPVQARFGQGEIALAGYDPLPASIQSGQALTVTLFWRANETPGRSYQVFVHVLTTDGDLVAQHDGPPRMGQYPTSVWAPGETVEDAHPISLPPGFGGTAHVVVGLYSLDSMERLPVTDAHGQGYVNRMVPLGPLLVGR